jgi:hypothetical protein
MWNRKPGLAFGAALLAAAVSSTTGAKPSGQGYTDTPKQPNAKWHIHDPNRPMPAVVSPGSWGQSATTRAAPSDAVVLLGAAGDLSQWSMHDGSAVRWKFKQGALETGKGDIRTRDEFRDFQLHIEWATPKLVQSAGQGRGNSGVFLLGQFEVQVLDSFENVTYADGQAAALYGQFPPLVNASRPPGEWQIYDIIFVAPVFKKRKFCRPAFVTVLHNGVVVHNATPFWGPTTHRAIGEYKPHMSKGPISLQDHGNPIRYRNIWIRPLKDYDSG